MHNPLPLEFRQKIAEIESQIDYMVEWGQFTQNIYPGECRWRLGKGSHGLKVEVSVTSTSDQGLLVVGIDDTRERLRFLESASLEASGYQSDADHMNAISEVTDVLLLLTTALVCHEKWVHWSLGAKK